MLLLTLTIYSPSFNAFDKATIQYFLISVLNLLALFIIPFIFSSLKIKNNLSHPLILLYSGYLLFAFLSIIKSINIVESFVRIGQLITFLISLSIIIFIVSNKLIKLNYVISIISISLVVDIFFSLETYFQFLINGVPFQFQDNPLLVGVYGNRNIIATIIAFKIPFLIIIIKNINKTYINIICFIVICLAFFNISILSSRATFLSIILTSLFILIFLLVRHINLKNRIKLNNLFVIYYFIPIILASFISSKAIDQSDEGNLTNRVASIASGNDASKNTRLRYYSQSLKHITQNPFLGGGIGNWKIISIKYDSKNIENYIIPYNAHNDILESAAETGIIGGIFFTSFFFLILYYLYRFLRLTIFKKNLNIIFVIISLPFITYFIDLNLNFPSSRPSNQVFLLLYISTILLLKSNKNAK